MISNNDETVIIDQLRYFLKDKQIASNQIITYKLKDLKNTGGYYCAMDATLDKSLQKQPSRKTERSQQVAQF